MREFDACSLLSPEQTEEQRVRLLKSLVNLGKRGKLGLAHREAINAAVRGLRLGAGGACTKASVGASVAVARSVGSRIPDPAPIQSEVRA
jgi:hypothetical protein